MSSYSTDVRNELARIVAQQECCNIAELASLMRMGGTMLIGGNNNLGIKFTTENAAVARKTLTLIKSGFHLKTEIMITRGRRLKKNNSYMIKVVPSPVVTDLLSVLGIMRNDNINVSSDSGLLRKACCRRSYLRGAFLGGGSVNRPEGDYHLELVTGNLDFGKTLVRMMKYFSLPVRLIERKNDYIVYLKDGDAIAAFLQTIGAVNALQTFESVRGLKDMRNQVNRLVNCETANLQKTVNAAVRQVNCIKIIIKHNQFDSLPPALKEAAETRLTYPEATLQELVDIMAGRVGRSGMNHRLRKLEQIAGELEP